MDDENSGNEEEPEQGEQGSDPSTNDLRNARKRQTEDPLENAESSPAMDEEAKQKIDEKMVPIEKMTKEERRKMDDMDQINKRLDKIIRAVISNANEIKSIQQDAETYKDRERYGDYLQLAIDRMNLEQVGDEIRTKKEKGVYKAVESFDTLARKLQEDIRGLNQSLFEGETDKYNVLGDKMKKIAEESGDQLAQEYFDLRKIYDQKHALIEEQRDLSLLLNVIFCYQMGIPVPKAILKELKGMADKYRKEDKQYQKGGQPGAELR